MQLVNPPVKTSHRLLHLSGKKDPGTLVTVSIENSTFHVEYSDDASFSVNVRLSKGTNQIKITSSTGQMVCYSVELEPIPVEKINLWNNLDDLGLLVNVDRLPEETNYSYRTWQLVSASAYKRGGDAQGLTNAALVSSRTKKSRFMRVSGHKPFVMFIKTGTIEVRSEAYVDSMVLKPGTYTKIQNTKVPEKVLVGNSDAYEFDANGKLIIKSTTSITFRYSVNVPKYENIKTIGSLLGKCSNSKILGGVSGCAKGVQPDGIEPQVYHQTGSGCGNGMCPLFESNGLRVGFNSDYKDESGLGIVPGIYVSEWNGEEYVVDLDYSNVWVLMLSEPEVIDYLIGDSNPDDPNSKIEGIRQSLNSVMPYLFDTVLEDRAIFADDIGVDQSFSLPPRMDVELPAAPMSGGYLNPRLENTDYGVRVRVDSTHFWLGSELYFLFSNKKAKTALQCSTISFVFSQTVFSTTNGVVYSGIPGDVSNSGETEHLHDYSLSSVSISGIVIPSNSVILYGDKIEINLNKILTLRPDLSKHITINSYLDLELEKDGQLFLRRLMLNTGSIETSINSTGPVFLTDETMTEDPSQRNLTYYPVGHFTTENLE